jgi:hypothetical protein
MNGELETPSNRDALLETFAAELTVVAYRVALRTGARRTWLDLQLDLWRALSDTVETWGKDLCGPAKAARRTALEQAGRTD